MVKALRLWALGALLTFWPLARFAAWAEAVSPIPAASAIAVKLLLGAGFLLVLLSRCILRRASLGIVLLGTGGLIAIEFRFPVEALGLLGRRCRRLHLSQQTEVMIGVLRIIFAQYPVPRRHGVARELQITLVNERGRPSYLYLGAIALHGAVRLVAMPAPAAVAVEIAAAAGLTTATALTLH